MFCWAQSQRAHPHGSLYPLGRGTLENLRVRDALTKGYEQPIYDAGTITGLRLVGKSRAGI